MVVRLGVSSQERWYDAKPEGSAIERFVKEATFAKKAYRNEIAFLVGDYSAAARFSLPLVPLPSTENSRKLESPLPQTQKTQARSPSPIRMAISHVNKV
jgi:hypothetical protein